MNKTLLLARIGAIVLLNTFLCFVIYSTVKVSLNLILTHPNDYFSIIEGATNTVAILLISYGVITEGSPSVMELIHMYPKYHNALNDKIDHHDHYFGLTILILGLLLEVPIQCIKVSDTILNTTNIERHLLWATLFIMTYTFFHILFSTIKLLKTAWSVRPWKNLY